MRQNKESHIPATHEGARAATLTNEQMLVRSVLACLLWEDTFYEQGEDIAARITRLVLSVKPEFAYEVAIAARTKMKLRHVPLLIARALASISPKGNWAEKTIAEVIQRPDELAEYLAIYWKNKDSGGKTIIGKTPLSAQSKRGLAKAFTKFSEYQLAKYNRDNMPIKLRDVLFLCHAKPLNIEQAQLWLRLIDKDLVIPDTWEVAISACKSEEEKKSEFSRLLTEGKMGALAVLRNLRNFIKNHVPEGLVKTAIAELKTDRVLPYRFISAARHAPHLEGDLEASMFKCLEGYDRLDGKTVLLVDVSGSMEGRVSEKSDITAMDAASGLAIMAREIAEDVKVYTFSSQVVPVPNRRGFALRDAIVHSQAHGGTQLGAALSWINKHVHYDRLIVITDEQSADPVGKPLTAKSYMINVASNQNGVGYGDWTRVTGWSEAILDYITELEKA